ncbi:hypothetical protein [Phenylobacterium sp.]|uniref:hypothetical protein n=1 Tax=Phenylobacterium sp. TaxID=1871053 RepID=UPI0027321346|nr:hypothetical protein [Phenylobacterium sp.]MDP1873651.1 hypothetical protein [Phenylobacterium sp.]
MTTIAYRDGELAADSQLTSCNNAPAGEVTKAWQTEDGSLWAHSGAAQDAERLAHWTHGPRDPSPPEIDDGVLIQVTPAGVVRQWWGKGWIEASADSYAWGSGERCARAAMMAGATPERAVEIAAALDSDTGGTITVLRLNEPIAPAMPTAAAGQSGPNPGTPMTPEEVRLKALEFATTYTLAAGGFQTRKPLVETAAEIAAFIESGKAPEQPKVEPHTLPPLGSADDPKTRGVEEAGDPIQMARKALYDAGGLSVDLSNCRVVANDPDSQVLQARARAYNALADFHAKQSADARASEARRGLLARLGL